MARLLIDQPAVTGNLRRLAAHLGARGLRLLPVLKLCGVWSELARALPWSETAPVAVATLAQAQAFHDATGRRPRCIGLPPVSRAREVTLHACASHVSHGEHLVALSRAAADTGLRHGVLLAVDMGDLREGCSPAEVPALLAEARSLEHSHFALEGLAVNFGCLSGAPPSHGAVEEFLAMARHFLADRPEAVISLGGSILLPWLRRNAMSAGATELRCGEAIFLGCFQDLDLGVDGLRREAVRFEAEVLESRRKPGRPGGAPRRRVVLDFGLMDLDPAGLSPLAQGLRLAGATSNYAVYDAEDCPLPLAPGDQVEFLPNYEALARAFHAVAVEKRPLPADPEPRPRRP